MRVLISAAYGSKGDVLPFYGIALELRKRGHDVYVFIGEAQYSFISSQKESSEINVVEIKAEFNGENNWAPGTTASLKQRAESISEKWLSTLRVLYNALAEKILVDRTVLVSHPLNFAARLVQESHAIPNVTVVLQPWLLRSHNRVPLSQPQFVFDCYPDCLKSLLFRYMDSVSDHYFTPEINKLATELGIETSKHAYRIFNEWFLSPDKVVLAFPSWYCPRQADWPRASVMEYTHFPLWKDTSLSSLGVGSDRLMDFLASDSHKHPPIVITCGTANPFCSGSDYFLALAQACSKLNYPSIILTSEPSYIPPPHSSFTSSPSDNNTSNASTARCSLPADCIHFSYLPLSSLLQHCSCCIHHGGIGTSAECLRAGIPQLIIPTQFDQFDNASLLTDYVGVALTLPAHKVVMKHKSKSDHIYDVAALDTLSSLLKDKDRLKNCYDVATSMKDVEVNEGYLNMMCNSIEKMLPAGLAFDNLDFSSTLARNDLFSQIASGADDTAADYSHPKYSTQASSKKPKKILTRLQYEMLLLQQQQEEQEDVATVNAIVDKDEKEQKKNSSSNKTTNTPTNTGKSRSRRTKAEKKPIKRRSSSNKVNDLNSSRSGSASASARSIVAV